jgi:hypothetical protein
VFGEGDHLGPFCGFLAVPIVIAAIVGVVLAVVGAAWLLSAIGNDIQYGVFVGGSKPVGEIIEKNLPEYQHFIAEAQQNGDVSSGLTNGASLTFHVQAENTGTYGLFVTAADGQEYYGGATVDVSVNGGAPMSLEIIYGKFYLADDPTPIHLQAGNNTIYLSNESAPYAISSIIVIPGDVFNPPLNQVKNSPAEQAKKLHD